MQSHIQGGLNNNEPICLLCKKEGGHFAQWLILLCHHVAHFGWLISIM